MKKIFTIGYTQKSAKVFFETLVKNKIDVVADIRVSNTGQLAGFTKKADLQYFLSLFGISYVYWSDLAPTREVRDRYLESKNWLEYESSYKDLIEERKSLKNLDISEFKEKNVVLLCSEPKADNCHRKIVAEAISKMLKIEIVHL